MLDRMDRDVIHQLAKDTFKDEFGGSPQAYRERMQPQPSSTDEFSHTFKYWQQIEPEIESMCGRMNKLVADYYEGIQMAKKEKVENGEEYEEAR